ncbi:LysR substrate-binding domain-containing protein, partial [Acinetobacter baumannii]|nr:LysR family transcriptional regulator [Acinetobacter baumannii]
SDIELTTTGQQLLTHVKELLSISDTLEKEVAAIHGLNEGTLRIGSFGASSSIYLLPEILEAFRQCYPKIEIYIDEGEDKEVAQWLLERRIEVGFLIMPDERFDTFPLIEDRFVALIPSGYPLAQQLYIDPAQLENCPFIMTMAGSRHQVELILKNFNVKPDIKFYVSQILSIVSMVHNQLGISIVSDMVITKELLSLYPNVVKRPFKPNLKRSIGLAVKNKKHISPAVKAFIEVAQEVWSDH